MNGPEESTDIAPVSHNTLEAFKLEMPLIQKEVVRRSLEREDEIEHHGQEAERIMEAGVGFVTRMLEAAMTVGGTSLLDDQAAWARNRLPHEGVRMQHIINRLTIYSDVVGEMMSSQQVEEIVPYIEHLKSSLQSQIPASS
jgi:hypothetical protein